jgi:hypothetical protein
VCWSSFSARSRSVTSSWTETHPPPSTGLLRIEMVGPSGSSMVLVFDPTLLEQLGDEPIRIIASNFSLAFQTV